MGAPTYLLATRSPGKLRELHTLFAQAAVNVMNLTDVGVPESAAESDIEAFDTFAENSVAKSEYFHRLTGLLTFADDSGLAVHALDGAPGVRSKRWSERVDLDGDALDTANNTKLITTLHPLGLTIPSAEYVCAAAFTDSAGTTVALGRTAGHIVRAPVGTHGFGYDPHFYSAELHKTFGEATTVEKLTVSHRSRAFQALLTQLRDSGRMTP